MTNAHGCDISLWQDDNSTPQSFNFQLARSRGLSFVGIKTSQGNWADPDYAMNWANAKRYLYRMPYHFLTWDIKPTIQADVFWSLIEKDTFGLLPLIVDFEWWKVVPQKAMDILYNFCVRLKKLCGSIPCGIYTSNQFWKESGSSSDYWKNFDLWLCDIEGYIQIPTPWSTFSFHQYTFKGSGRHYGAESNDLDMNWFNGSLEQMIERYHLPDIGLTDQILPPPNSKNKRAIVDVFSGLRLRAEPNDLSYHIATLKDGTEIEILDRTVDKDGNTWVKISGWLAEEYHLKKLLRPK